MSDATADKTTASQIKHKTTPLADSLTHISGYPKKLTLYKLPASSYWWVRYYVDGKVVRRTTKTEKKNEAIKFAKAFYDEIMLRRASGLAVTNKSRFDICATNMLTAMNAQVARKEITQQTYEISAAELAHQQEARQAYCDDAYGD